MTSLVNLDGKPLRAWGLSSLPFLPQKNAKEVYLKLFWIDFSLPWDANVLTQSFGWQPEGALLPRLVDNALILATPPCSLHSAACQSVHGRTALHPEGNQANFKVRLSQRIWLNYASLICAQCVFIQCFFYVFHKFSWIIIISNLCAHVWPPIYHLENGSPFYWLADHSWAAVVSSGDISRIAFPDSRWASLPRGRTAGFLLGI